MFILCCFFYILKKVKVFFSFLCSCTSISYPMISCSLVPTIHQVSRVQLWYSTWDCSLMFFISLQGLLWDLLLPPLLPQTLAQPVQSPPVLLEMPQQDSSWAARWCKNSVHAGSVPLLSTYPFPTAFPLILLFSHSLFISSVPEEMADKRRGIRDAAWGALEQLLTACHPLLGSDISGRVCWAMPARQTWPSHQMND